MVLNVPGRRGNSLTMVHGSCWPKSGEVDGLLLGGDGFGGDLSVEKGIGGEEGREESVHTAVVVAVGLVGGLEDGGVVEGFVSTHPVAEGVADEDLFDAFALGELGDQVEGVGDGAIEGGVAGIDDFAGGVDGFAVFVFAVEADVVIHLEGEAEGVHFLMTAPAVFLAGDTHAGAEGGPGFVRELGVDGDGDVGHAAAEKALLNPEAAVDGVVVHGIGLGDEPGGVGENAEALAFGGGGEFALGFEGAFSK